MPFEANALDLTAQPRINTGMMYYQFEQSDHFNVVVFDGRQLSAGVTDITYGDVMPFIGGGATVFLDRFYVDGYVQKAFSGKGVDIQDSKTFAIGPKELKSFACAAITPNFPIARHQSRLSHRLD